MHDIHAITYYALSKSCILSILSYGGAFLQNSNKSEIKMLNIFLHKVVRFLTCSPQHVPIDQLYLLTSEMHIDKQLASTLRHQAPFQHLTSLKKLV